MKRYKSRHFGFYTFDIKIEYRSDRNHTIAQFKIDFFYFFGHIVVDCAICNMNIFTDSLCLSKSFCHCTMIFVGLIQEDPSTNSNRKREHSLEQGKRLFIENDRHHGYTPSERSTVTMRYGIFHGKPRQIVCHWLMIFARWFKEDHSIKKLK
jgi:hypothetical protein